MAESGTARLREVTAETGGRGAAGVRADEIETAGSSAPGADSATSDTADSETVSSNAATPGTAGSGSAGSDSAEPQTAGMAPADSGVAGAKAPADPSSVEHVDAVAGSGRSDADRARSDEKADGRGDAAETDQGSEDGSAGPGAAQVALPLARKRRRESVAGTPTAVPSDLPPFSPAARPTWTPMQVRPTVRPTAGITLFGTRLTYRQAAIGAAALLAVVLLVIVLAAKAFSGGDKTTSRGAAPTTHAAAPAGGQPAGKTPSSLPSSAPSTPPSSVPSSVPVSSAPATGANITLPAGWHWFSRPTQGDWPGFVIPAPQKAQVEVHGSEVELRWNNRLLIVDRTDAPQPDPVKDWEQQEASRTYPDYHKIKIVPVSYFKAGADWEFTYTTDRGNPQHADKRNILVSSTAAYSLNWYTTPQDWAAAQSDIQLIYRGFQPQP